MHWLKTESIYKHFTKRLSPSNSIIGNSYPGKVIFCSQEINPISHSNKNTGSIPHNNFETKPPASSKACRQPASQSVILSDRKINSPHFLSIHLSCAGCQHLAWYLLGGWWWEFPISIAGSLVTVHHPSVPPSSCNFLSAPAANRLRLVTSSFSHITPSRRSSSAISHQQTSKKQHFSLHFIPSATTTTILLRLFFCARKA